MNKVIGIRREDKNQWERRAPLTPDDVKELNQKYGMKTIVQPSTIRIFTDDAYKNAGAEINEDLSKAGVVLAIKEIPLHLFEKKQNLYFLFPHHQRPTP